jgi:hypothetical protein
VKNCDCCQIATRDSGSARPSSRWRRGGEITGWIIPSATLVFLPKCPVCVAMYVALFSGVGISIASASKLRTSVIILCVVTLVCLALKRLRAVPSVESRDFSKVGTPWHGVPARVPAGGTGYAQRANHALRCAAERGADGAGAPSLPGNLG